MDPPGSVQYTKCHGYVPGSTHPTPSARRRSGAGRMRVCVAKTARP